MIIPILSSIYADDSHELRVGYPLNMVPVAVDSGISSGVLRPAHGIVSGPASAGASRAAFVWKGELFRLCGGKLQRVNADDTIDTVATIGDSGLAAMAGSFDRLAIATGGSLYYWDGTDLTKVTDPDLGVVNDVTFQDGYFITTDGDSVVVTELDDPTSVNPLKYGSAEQNTDRIVAVKTMRSELYVIGEHSIEVFDNVGGTGFPFQRITGAYIPKGCVGTHACATFMGDAVAFVGGSKDESPAVYLATNGTALKVSGKDIDEVIQSESNLSTVLVESMVDQGHQLVLIHLSGETLVYDHATTQIAGTPVWYRLQSDNGQYRATHHQWFNNRWYVADPVANRTGYLSDATQHHYGSVVPWEFATPAIYNEGRGAIINQLELVSLTGRLTATAPRISYRSSQDGVTFSQWRTIQSGTRGELAKRLVWRRCGVARNWRVEQFRGTSDTPISVARLEANIEPLNA